MKVLNVHYRDLEAPPERVGAVLASLGSEHDRLWPIDRWPALPFELDGPLAVGARGGHGMIPYAVEQYEPGRRLVFRLAPGLGLDGTHRFEIEAVGPDRTRLVHTLDCRVKPTMLALWPIVRGYHDALVEDILDRAELSATGSRVRPRRWPVWLRIANGTEVWIARRRGNLPPATRPPGAPDAHPDSLTRLSGVAVPAGLAAIAALHGAWALGWRWPGGSDSELAERVIGAGSELPPDWATWLVAGVLAGSAVVVRTAATAEASPFVRRLAWAVAGVLLVRGTVSIPVDLTRGFDEIYERLDLVIYSPVCLALGAGAAIVARRAHWHARPGLTAEAAS